MRVKIYAFRRRAPEPAARTVLYGDIIPPNREQLMRALRATLPPVERSTSDEIGLRAVLERMLRSRDA